jgi:hypothetical protein
MTTPLSSESVECYSGQSYPERPRSFLWEGERLEVAEILSRWRTPESTRFQIRIEDGRIFELIYHEPQDRWIIELK